MYWLISVHGPSVRLSTAPVEIILNRLAELTLLVRTQTFSNITLDAFYIIKTLRGRFSYARIWKTPSDDQTICYGILKSLAHPIYCFGLVNSVRDFVRTPHEGYWLKSYRSAICILWVYDPNFLNSLNPEFFRPKCFIQFQFKPTVTQMNVNR